MSIFKAAHDGKVISEDLIHGKHQYKGRNSIT